MKCFISYTTKDKEITLELLKALSERLKVFAHVFIDIIDNDSIDRQDRVIAEIDSSDVLILIETISIYKSDWVAFEIARAIDKQIPIEKVSLLEVNQIVYNKAAPNFISSLAGLEPKY